MPIPATRMETTASFAFVLMDPPREYLLCTSSAGQFQAVLRPNRRLWTACRGSARLSAELGREPMARFRMSLMVAGFLAAFALPAQTGPDPRENSFQLF